MARRSDYPFRKSDVKFGTNLIATLFSIPISLGARAVIDGSKDLLSTYPTDTAKIPSEATQGKIGRLEFAIGVIGLTLLLTLGVYWACLPKGYAIVSFFGEILIISSLVLLIFLISAFVTQCIEEIKTGNDVLSLQKGYQWVEIDDSLVNIFYQSLNVELYFYFTRPLLSEAEYL